MSKKGIHACMMAVTLGAWLLAACGIPATVAVPESQSSTGTPVPPTNAAVPRTNSPVTRPTFPTEVTPKAAASSPETSDRSDVQLSQTHVFAEFGYEIDYPAGWQAHTRGSQTAITEVDADYEGLSRPGFSLEGYLVTMDHTDVSRARRAGLPDDPGPGDLLVFSMAALGMPQPVADDVSQIILFGVPSLRVKSGREGRWAVTHIGVKDEKLFLLIVTAPSEQALDEFMPTWQKMLDSIKRVEDEASVFHVEIVDVAGVQ